MRFALMDYLELGKEQVPEMVPVEPKRNAAVVSSPPRRKSVFQDENPVNKTKMAERVTF